MPDDPPVYRRGLSMKFVLAFLLGLLGFAVVVQLKQVESKAYSVRGSELVELLKSLDAANERTESEITDLRQTRDDLRTATQGSNKASAEAKRRAGELAILAGSVAAKGPGIELTIEDPDHLVDAALLLDIVEELRDGSAEVVAINATARVVAQTAFVDDRGAIRIGGQRISPPYEIAAIGDSETLDESIRFRGGVLDRLQNRGATGIVTVRPSITITALAHLKEPEYARAESSSKE